MSEQEQAYYNKLYVVMKEEKHKVSKKCGGAGLMLLRQINSTQKGK